MDTWGSDGRGAGRKCLHRGTLGNYTLVRNSEACLANGRSSSGQNGLIGRGSAKTQNSRSLPTIERLVPSAEPGLKAAGQAKIVKADVAVTTKYTHSLLE